MHTVRSGAVRSLLSACALLSIAAACAREKPSAAPAAAHDSAAAAPAPAPDPVGLVPIPEDPTTKELESLRLTIPMLQHWARAQVAVDSATLANPRMLDSMKKAAPRSLDEMISVIDAQAPIRNALKRSGFTVRDYVLTMIAMNQAINGYQRQAAGQPLPPNMPPAMKENIALVGKNITEIKQILAPAMKR